jgi:hypothetical protein
MLACLLACAVVACSPEAHRARDGGPGADPGNKRIVPAPPANPVAADTTLWPGRAPSPVERLQRGTMPLPAGLSRAAPERRPDTTHSTAPSSH